MTSEVAVDGNAYAALFLAAQLSLHEYSPKALPILPFGSMHVSSD
jgi:hypothetical protein